MKKILIAAIIFALSLTMNTMAVSNSKTIKIGIILSFTGPIESLTPVMAASTELALNEASESGSLLDGSKIEVVRVDSACDDSTAIKAAKEIYSQGAIAIVGGDCPSVTAKIVSNVAIPNGLVMISPLATSPALTELADNGLFFRTVSSDKRDGQVLADATKDKKIKNIAITYQNSDYGKNLSDMYKIGLASHGIKVTVDIAYEDGKTDYSSEVATLAAAGGDAVAVLGYFDEGGKGIIQASLDSGMFDTFVLGDGMIEQSLIDVFGNDLKNSIAIKPGSEGKGMKLFANIADAGGIDPEAAYAASSYDAGALLVLAIQAGQSADKRSIAKNIMGVANAPGTKIYPGELKKGLDLLAKGKKINYEGTSNITFTEKGDATGSFLEQIVKDGKFVTRRTR